MEDKQAVYWHQGMFLQPQHFQLADQHNRFTQTPLFEAGVPHFWGVGALELSKSAVANRTIDVRHARLLFRDHHYVQYPENAVIAPRTFDASWVQGDRPLTVYLGVRRASEQDRNVTEVGTLAEAADATTRFATVMSVPETPDLYSQGPGAPLQTLRYVLKVFFESELDHLDQYELIPVARLVRDGDTVVLADRFIPPSYALAGSDALRAMLREIRDELSGRARQLQEYKSPREMQKAEFDASYMLFLLALRSLNRFSPSLFHLIESEQVHPWMAYGVLRQLVGELSSFSERFNMLGEMDGGGAGLPPYDHLDLDTCFSRARVTIGHLLNEITVGPEYLVVLEPRDGVYQGQVPRSMFGNRNRFYLVVRTQEDPQWVADGIVNGARLAALGDIPTLVRHALPGLELIHMPHAPQGLPRRAHSFYFRIEQVSEQWELVEREGDIALHWLDAPADLRAEVVILRR
ncbi:type VI secretion system baseplate subunit TssK [Caballeronia sp. LZ034LL]|uniref:type VI secretion system baseplate subunit TssK n=1 Tax=Caballeronia sp. LZ034LL TaxID=3038567 RepID=UPI0028629A24|nr:type VI secretion system baseplate subunit TssK [Caballeronia sp. LZ034LL]MDR5837091.1 type VI secretion system baseplate subunit TssK [Caballeronia sp. LZ034LL]